MLVVGAAAALAQTGSSPDGAAAPHAVYVAEFQSGQVKEQGLLASFTELFETALINTGDYRVLNRRSFHQTLQEAQNEERVRSMSDLSQRARGQLRQTAGAEGVIFGEVTDDPASGEITVSVTLESFDAVKHWKYETSMTRGRTLDRASRQEAMRALVALIGARGSAPSDPSTRRGSAAQRTVPSRRCPPALDETPQEEDSFDDLTFRLETARIRGRTVSLRVFVTNEGPARRLFTALAGGSYGGPTSEILDDCAQTFPATKISISGRDWAAEIPGRTTITLLATFEIPADADPSAVVRFQQITLKFSEPQRKSAIFRNIPVQR
jgi:hypothetical protein